MSSKVKERETLTEEQRKQVQLRQANELTMQGHVRDKLRLGRRRLAQTWGLEGSGDDGGDDMQILARDMKLIFATPETLIAMQNGNQQLPPPPATPVLATPISEPTRAAPKWLLPAVVAASLLGGGGLGGLMVHLLSPTAPATVDTDTDTITDVRLPE